MSSKGSNKGSDDGVVKCFRIIMDLEAIATRGQGTAFRDKIETSEKGCLRDKGATKVVRTLTKRGPQNQSKNSP